LEEEGRERVELVECKRCQKREEAVSNLADGPAERTYKSIIFEVLPEAIEAERSMSGRLDARGLFYAVRRLYLPHPERPYERERRLAASSGKTNPLEYQYFNNQLIPAYEREFGEIEGLTREPRGHLHPAHMSATEEQEIGTVFAADFEPPEYYYDKVLYVEKHGIALSLVDAGVGQRYDMAIVASRGYGTEAERRLMQHFEEAEYETYILHDCDVDGYGIVANLREGNERLRDVSVDVVDLGTSLADALAFDPPLIGEEATRQKAIPAATIAQIATEECELFTGCQRNAKVWEYTRYELNEIPSEERVPFVERKLRDAGVGKKVIPPDGYLGEAASEMVADDFESEVRMAIHEVVGTDAIVEALLPDFADRYDVEDPQELRSYIRAEFAKRPRSSWRTRLQSRIAGKGADFREEIEEGVEQEILRNLTDEDEEE
jgi:hypothetical protein